MPVATIISGIIAAGTAVAGGVMQYKAQKEADKENKALAGVYREDVLKQQDTQNQLQKQQLALTAREARENRKERAEERGYNRMQHAADKFAEYKNSKNALLQNRTSALRR